jgi:chromosome segregation ATPase
MKAIIVILLIFSLGLGGALLMRHTKAVQEKQKDDEQIVELSNVVKETRGKLDEQESISIYLRTNLDLTLQKLSTKSNEASKLANDLANAQALAKANEEAYKAAKMKSDQQQVEIDKLTGQMNDQTKQLTDLNSAIDKLNKMIKETERKLSASEGDREFLLKELKRMTTEKAELERQFNDLAVLRSQVSKLRDELSIAKRLEWIRMGLYGSMEQRGAERLLFSTPSSTATSRPGFDLNVELKQDGTAVIVPKSGTTTNKPVPVPR